MILATLLLFSTLNSAAATGDLFRPLDLEAAQSAAQTERRCVMVQFSSLGSADSKKLDSTTWTEKNVREWLVLKSVPIKLDYDKNAELVARLRIHVAPTIVFLTASGSEIDRITGYVDGRTFLAETRDIFGAKDPLARARKRLAEDEHDPHRRIDVGIALEDAGLFADALAHFLWCWDHGLDHDPTFIAGRRKFLLSELIRITRLYPPAGDALIERAQSLFVRVSTCVATDSELDDIVALNRELQRTESTLAAYDALDPTREECAALREKLGPRIVNPMIDAKRYIEALALIGDPRERFNQLVVRFRAESKRLTAERPREAAALIDAEQRGMRIESARLYETCLGAARFDDAESLSKMILAFDGKGQMYCALMRSALRVEAHGSAKSLFNLALRDKALTPSEREDVKKVADGIIQPK